MAARDLDFIHLPEKDRAEIILCNKDDSAIWRTGDAVSHTMLELEPQAGTVSWMITISRALQTGGIQTACACYEDPKDRVSKEYIFNDYELIGLVFGLIGAGKTNLAIDVLNLNLPAFPESVDTYAYLANLHLRKGQTLLAKELLEKTMSIDPNNAEAMLLLEKVRQQ